MLNIADGTRARLKHLLRVFGTQDKMNLCDVGARMRSTPPYKLLHKLGGCHVWGFEPDDDAFAALEEAGHESATYFKAAIGKPGKATFYRHPIGSISSLFPIAPASARYLGKYHWIDRDDIREIPIEVTALDKIEGLPPVDVLKIDIQGGELEVFKSGKKALEDAVAIIPEVRFYRMYEGEPMWRDVDAQLAKMGFVLHKFLHAKQVTLPGRLSRQMRKRRGSQLLDGDAVYIRSLEEIDKVSDRQLRMMALAAETMFHSYDLALMCLEELARREVIPARAAQKYFDKLPGEWKKERAA